MGWILSHLVSESKELPRYRIDVWIPLYAVILVFLISGAISTRPTTLSNIGILIISLVIGIFVFPLAVLILLVGFLIDAIRGI